jgi:hypothetical protein
VPITSDDRRTGATSISRMKPNSRSHTMEMAEKMAVNSTAMASAPGNMNVLKLSLPVTPRVIPPNLLPRTNRNSTGCIREVKMRSLM